MSTDCLFGAIDISHGSAAQPSATALRRFRPFGSPENDSRPKQRWARRRAAWQRKKRSPP